MRLRIFERRQRLIQDIFYNSRFIDTAIARLSLNEMNSRSIVSFDQIRQTSGPRRNNSLTPPTLRRSFSSWTFNCFNSLLTLSSSRCRRSTSWCRSKQINAQSFTPFVGKRTSFQSKQIKRGWGGGIHFFVLFAAGCLSLSAPLPTCKREIQKHTNHLSKRRRKFCFIKTTSHRQIHISSRSVV